MITQGCAQALKTYFYDKLLVIAALAITLIVIQVVLVSWSVGRAGRQAIAWLFGIGVCYISSFLISYMYACSCLMTGLFYCVSYLSLIPFIFCNKRFLYHSLRVHPFLSPVCLSVRLSIYLCTVCFTISVPACACVGLSVCLSGCLSISICALHVSQYACVSVCLCVC